MDCKIIGIAGGSGSGKTTLCKKLASLWGDKCVVISSDDYYRPAKEFSLEARANQNFDHPDSLELDLLAEHLRQLRAGNDVEVPRYCFKSHDRLEEVHGVSPHDIVFVEGVLIFVDPGLREAMDLRVFVDADDVVRFRRRMDRDVAQRQRTATSVKEQWDATVAPMYAEFVEPTKKYAHLVVNTNDFNPFLEEWLSGAMR